MEKNKDDICCKFCRNKLVYRKATNGCRIYLFSIFNIFQIYLLHFILLNKCACLQIEISFSNEAENFEVNCNEAVDNLNNLCENCASDRIATERIPQSNVQDFSDNTPALAALLDRNDHIVDPGTIPIITGISSKKRKQDLFLPEFDKISNIQYSSLNQRQTNEKIVSQGEELQPLDLRTNKKQKTYDLIEFENNEWILKTPTSIIFEYSDKFCIQSKYFNKYKHTELNYVRYNITDLTKSKVDIATFEIFLFVLRFGCHKKCIDIKICSFITFLRLFCDLLCHAESDVIRNLYKSLLPSFFIYKNDISVNIHIETPENIFLVQKSLFLPFLNTFFSNVEVKFDQNTKELSLLKRESSLHLYSFDARNIDEIIIRTTSEVINILETESNINLKLFFWLISLFKIIGIKISNDNIYYSESKERDRICKYENSALAFPSPNLKLLYSHILESIISHNNNEIKFLELERVNISEGFLNFIKILCKIESLILYTCKLPAYSNFLCHLNFCFPKLKTLKVNTLILTAAFFKSLRNLKIEYLDLSWSTFDGKYSRDLELYDGIYTLCDLKLDNSRLGYNVINFLVKSNALEFLSMKNVDFSRLNRTKYFILLQRNYSSLDISGCFLNKNFMNFYSSNFKATSLSLRDLNSENLQKMLDLNSLHISTKILDLSKSCLDFKAIACLRKFKVLETLKLCSLPYVEFKYLNQEYSFEKNLYVIDLSDSKLIQENMVFLNRFEFLKELRLSRCNLKEGLIRYILPKSLFSSLEKLKISENSLDIYDFYLLSQIRNLKYLSITLENSIFRNSLKENDLMCFTKLNTLILTKTVITYEIFQFINQQYLLTHLHFKDCTFEIDFSSISITSSLKHLNHIVLINSKISADNKRRLEDLIIYNITVIVR
ncbi:hypothetical protein CWI38_0167p0030 [Hamiltosporidium tvaerminnensis]|uniref:Leucine-rich repeat-containing protein n=1 Tax=Hamiltosporidium tvaerminnensis TaxID=1176355 RepID=A0A4Q9M2N6_9MICR|nr:hypothetical protein CWI38_0167p0030 [Hamiltosporidium tvaerminnensis]